MTYQKYDKSESTKFALFFLFFSFYYKHQRPKIYHLYVILMILHDAIIAVCFIYKKLYLLHQNWIQTLKILYEAFSCWM